jgi:hypothetical protein
MKGKKVGQGTLAQELLSKFLKFAIFVGFDYIWFVKRS